MLHSPHFHIFLHFSLLYILLSPFSSIISIYFPENTHDHFHFLFSIFKTKYQINTNLINQLDFLIQQYKFMHSTHHSHNNPNPQHDHSHGHGHTHHAGCSHGQQHEIDPEQYFKNLKQLKDKNAEFYWMEVTKGAVLAKYLQKFGLGFLNSINANAIQGVVGMFHMMLTCDFVPVQLRPFISGLFWPLVLYMFVNYKILTGFNTQTNSQSKNIGREAQIIFFILPLVLYFLVGVRTSGSMKTTEKKKIGKKILEVRPYLQNPMMMCKVCDIPRAFRSVHCPVCKSCIPKFSRHSLVFGSCIGAGNQLLALLFFLSLGVCTGYSLYKFMNITQIFGIITKILFYFINISIFWMSWSEFFTFYLLNFRLGLTQFEIQNWMMLQYLMNVPARQFLNSCNNGLFHNLAEAIFSFLGVSGHERQIHDIKSFQQKENQPLKQQVSEPGENNSLEFPNLDQNKKYIVNWEKAFIVVIPQMPNHPKRNQVIQMMKAQEPRMVSNFKMIKKFSQQAKKQNPNLSQFQIRQKAMIKMSQHMAKNPQTMKPPSQQQKIIQLQMLGHMKMQFKNDAQIYQEFEDIESKLKSGSINPEQGALRMRNLQQKVMQKKMKQILEAQKAQKANGQKLQERKQQAAPSLQEKIQQQIMQKISERKQQMKQLSKNESKVELKKLEEEQSDMLKNQDLIDDENL